MNKSQETHTDLHDDATEFHEAISELLRVYSFRDRKRICCYDVSVTQCHALSSLVRGGPATLNALAESLYLDKSTASRVIDALEKKGYVTRTTDPDDARSLRLVATAPGCELQQRIEKDLIAEHRRLLADFDPEIRQATTRLIARLAREASARFSRTDGTCCT